MTDYIHLKKDRLSPGQKELLEPLKDISEDGFVLYGGTALSLHCAHRESDDFDFFTEKTLEVESLYKKFHFLQKSEVIQSSENTLVVLVPTNFDPVKVSFFGNIAFCATDNPVSEKNGRFLVASITDLLAAKLKVILQRIELKDYQDVAEILRTGEDLTSGLSRAKDMFGSVFSPNEALRALTYFDDSSLKELSAEDKNCITSAVKKYYKKPRIK